MDTETSRLRDATTALKAEEKELRSVLRGGTAQIPLPELRTAVITLQRAKAETTARLAKLQRGDVKPVSMEEREKISSAHRKWSRAAAARKKIRQELWADIQGQAETQERAEEIKEALGLEF